MNKQSSSSAGARDVIAALREEGYTLLAWELPADVPPKPAAERRPQPQQLKLKAGRSPVDAPPIEHRPPAVPLTIDQKELEADGIRQYDGRPLYFAVSAEGEHGSRLHAFTTEDEANDFVLSMIDSAHREDHDPHAFFGSHIWPTYPAYFFEHPGCGGARLQLDYRHAYWDLTQIWLGGILWWWTSWNDQMSSLSTTGRGVKLYEHIHWGGSWIYFGGSTLVWNLGDYGWDNRVSSIESTY